MAGTVEGLEDRPGDRGMRDLGMAIGDHRVVGAPRNEYRDVGGQVAAIEHRHVLAPPVDDRPQRPAECRTGITQAQIAQDAQEIGPVEQVATGRERLEGPGSVGLAAKARVARSTADMAPGRRSSASA